MARNVLVFCTLAALLLVSCHAAEEKQETPKPKPAAAAADKPVAEAAPAVPANNAELDAARVEIAALKEEAKNHQDKAKVLTKQLEKAEGTANRYREQTNSLNKEVQQQRTEATKLNEQIQVLEDELSAAKEGMAKAESERKSVGGQIESEWAGKLKAAEQDTEKVKLQLQKSEKETAALKALLESSDVQTYLQMRDMTSETAEYAAQKTAELVSVASEYTSTASDVLAEHYDVAWSEAQKLAAEHSPMAEDLHKQVLEQGTPLVNQATIAVQQGLDSGVASVFDLLDSIDVTKPYAKEASWWLVMGAAGLPTFLIAFFVFKYFVTLTSSLLFKMQYAGVFFMLGGVLTVHNLAVATKSDPISLLRQQHPALDASVHGVLAVVAVVLSSVHFITLVAKDNGGKSIKAQFASMIAAVLVLVVFCHYYFLVYLKRTDPKFEIKLEYSPDGHPSYLEYSLFFVALVFFTGLGLPAGFRFTARALYTAIESGFAGGLSSLCLFSAVTPDAFAKALSQDYFKWTCVVLSVVLVLVLLYRTFKKMTKGVSGGLFALVHLTIVCRVMYIVKKMADNHASVGPNLKYAAAGFLFVSLVHMFWVTFGKEYVSGLAPATPTNKKAAPPKSKPRGKK